MKLDLTKWAVVTAAHGEKFVGQVPADVESAWEYLFEAASNRQPVRLVNARLMLSQYGTSPTGLGGGIQTMVAFIPIDLADGPMEEINIVPSSWYFPGTTDDIVDKFTRLLKAAEDAEESNRTRQSAARANITLPGD